MDVALEIAILLGLFLLNGFFAMAEIAVVSSRRIKLQHMAEAGRRGAKQALRRWACASDRCSTGYPGSLRTATRSRSRWW